ncbi:MAG: nucleotide exchange factor GrpE, partial [Elioraea sp.]|nr:nucleotide exchange factor GrpE [Elioraea sp.]
RQDAAGAKFDPELHQAMAEAPSPAVPAGPVAQAWTPVWTGNGRLLKPAMVVVSTGGPAQAAAPAEPAAPPGGSIDATV